MSPCILVIIYFYYWLLFSFYYDFFVIENIGPKCLNFGLNTLTAYYQYSRNSECTKNYTASTSTSGFVLP